MNKILKKVSCLQTKFKSLQLLESRSPLSSPCSFLPKKFDVFLSFRGADTRKSFISLLDNELKAEGMRIFKDEDELEGGCEISQNLNQAIKESRIAVIVVSATYTASVWCLQELVKILKRQKEDLVTVLPVFYEVDPCDLRRNTGEVKKHFKKHKKRQSRETVKSWRDALKYLASISGVCSKDCEDDLKLVDKTKECISMLLFSTTPSNSINLIGINDHMKKLYPLLDLNSNQGVQVIGIWGRGTMGRSVFAKHVYENISHNFEAHCFLQDVTRISLHHRKSYLKEELLSKMQGQGLSTKSCLNGIKARVMNKKVLLVANNVDKLEQLGALSDEFSLFGPGSMIIIATQDRQLLNSWNVKNVYENEHFMCYVRQLVRYEAFTQRDNHVGFKRSTYRHMNLSGNNFFSTLKDLMRARYYCAQMKKSPEAQMLNPPVTTRTQQKLCAIFKWYLQQKAKAKARRCSSQEAKMLDPPAKIGTREQFSAIVKMYLQQKAQAKARRCSSRTALLSLDDQSA